MSLVSRGIHSTFAEALTDCRLCILRSEHVIHLMKKEPQVTLRILESMALRLKQAESKLEDLAFKGIPARLTSLLLALARGEGGTRVVDGYSHQDLAEMLGTYRETTTQVLNNFKEQGWIEIGRRQITILDLQAMLNATSSGRPPEPQGRREPGSHRMA
jgi:CRP-like cAMP-binding protein